MKTKKYVLEYKLRENNLAITKETWNTEAYDATDAVTQLEVHLGNRLHSVLSVKPYVTLENQKTSSEKLLTENETART